MNYFLKKVNNVKINNLELTNLIFTLPHVFCVTFTHFTKDPLEVLRKKSKFKLIINSAFIKGHVIPFFGTYVIERSFTIPKRSYFIQMSNVCGYIFLNIPKFYHSSFLYLSEDVEIFLENNSSQYLYITNIMYLKY